MNKDQKPAQGMARPGGGPGAHNRGAMPIEKPKNAKATVGRLFAYIGQSRYLVILLMLVMVLSTVLSLAAPALQGFAIDSLTLSDGELHVDFDRLIKMLTAIAGVYILTSLFNYFQGIIAAKISQDTVYILRRDLFSKFSYLPIRFTDTHRHGDLMSRMTNDVDNISMTISQSIATLVSSVLTIIGAVFMLFWYNWIMALVTIITVPLTVFSSLFLSKFMRKYFTERQKLLGRLNSQVEEMVTGYKTVMAYGKEDDACADFAVISEELRQCNIKANVWGGVMGPVMNFLNNLSYLIVASVGGYMTLRGFITIGNIQSILQYSRQLSMPLNQVANMYAQILTAIAGAERVFEILDTDGETDEGNIELDIPAVRGDLDFKNIDFSYVPEKQVLKNFNLSVKAGQKIAIVGATGSGKTTIVNLLTRFYDIDSGTITLDGVDITKITKKSLRESIAIVLQDTVLFSDSIKQNILYGKLDASDADIEYAAKTANCASFIGKLPKKYNTVLSESGGNLSQGQRQLISIARAVLADPKILILDEATSSVDTRTEMKIQSAMVKLMKNRTSLIIAHRLSTIRDADVIVVISDGHAVEAGSHDELLAQKGEYYKLYQNQFAGIAT